MIVILIYKIKNVNLNLLLFLVVGNFNFNLGRTEGTEAEEPLKTRSRMEQPHVKK